MNGHIEYDGPIMFSIYKVHTYYGKKLKKNCESRSKQGFISSLAKHIDEMRHV